MLYLFQVSIRNFLTPENFLSNFSFRGFLFLNIKILLKTFKYGIIFPYL